MKTKAQLPSGHVPKQLPSHARPTVTDPNTLARIFEAMHSNACDPASTVDEVFSQLALELWWAGFGLVNF